MGRDGMLGTFEEQVLLAIAHVGDDAYGMTVRREIEVRTGQPVAIGAVYATLDRLEGKGLVESWLSDPEREHRRAARRFVRLRKEGVSALRSAQAVRARMWKGLDPARLSAGKRRT